MHIALEWTEILYLKQTHFSAVKDIQHMSQFVRPHMPLISASFSASQ